MDMDTQSFLKAVTLSLFLITGGMSYSYAQSPLPPGENTNGLAGEKWEVGLDERLWDSSKNVQLAPDREVVLSGDRSINSLRTSANKENIHLNLNGHRLTVGSGGVIIEGGRSHIITGGALTSSVGNIKFTSIGNPAYHILPISSVISDNKNTRVGLEIINTSTTYNGIGLFGGHANTFTGDVNVTGRVLLDLYKDTGVVSILGNLNVKEGAKVSVLRSGQLGRGARVLLNSKSNAPSVLGLNGNYEKNIKEIFHELKVDGNAVVSFSLDNDRKPHGRREIILDDLQVMDGSHLLVKEWQEGRDRLLVKKSSEHVRDSLKRIAFENHDTQSVNLRDYDKDYWEVYALVPEPATYGLLLGAVVVGGVLLRRQTSREE